MKPRKPKWRAGDHVRIVTPRFFVRCGYPLDFATACDQARTGADAAAINEFVSDRHLKATALQLS